MIEKNKATRLLAAITATMFSALAVIIIDRIHPNGSVVLLGLIFIAAWTGFYLLLLWVSIDRPAELEAKHPVTPEEHKRRRQEFYNWLGRY